MRKMNYKKITIEELAAIISKKLQDHGIDSILVGGGCVSIYSHNRYQSYDLDYVTYEDIKKVANALEPISIKFFVEFLDYFDLLSTSFLGGYIPRRYCSQE
ncbi:MAG: hypothetical protein COT85_00335 [Chlamydiae bacterium CG10_big_fil_rev_8_21_14_0_10_42_34]|nr:MAG: hypothetical protein COT85_00335 [Chlamydiae bacterium CG10_big_fil_rev_8_21_14_0_10_42_34]